MKISRDFSARSEVERKWITENTWCGECGVADLGMTNPEEFEYEEEIFIEGSCQKCGATVRTYFRERNA